MAATHMKRYSTPLMIKTGEMTQWVKIIKENQFVKVVLRPSHKVPTHISDTHIHR